MSEGPLSNTTSRQNGHTGPAVLLAEKMGLGELKRRLRELVEGQLARAREHHNMRPVAVGVGSAGPITPNVDTVSPLNIQSWNAFPLRERLVAAGLARAALRKPQDLISFILGHRARTAAAHAPRVNVIIVCSTPDGKPAVEISL